MTGGTEKSVSDKRESGACLQKHSAWVWDWVLVVPCWKAMSDCQILISEKIIGDELPFYANIGIAQLENAVKRQTKPTR
jgi:hypothetical protein